MGTNFHTDADPTCNNPAHTDALHIGKSSAGWKFGFRAYDDRGLTSWAAWRAFLKGREIRDEYGHTLTLDEFAERVTNRMIPAGEETPFCRVEPSPGCRALGYGGQWCPPEDTEHGPMRFHDPEGFDFDRGEFS